MVALCCMCPTCVKCSVVVKHNKQSCHHHKQPSPYEDRPNLPTRAGKVVQELGEGRTGQGGVEWERDGNRQSGSGKESGSELVVPVKSEPLFRPDPPQC